MGRASRHVDGQVIMYADTVTRSMKAAIEETKRRRQIQEAYNREHGITPQGIRKAIKDITERVKVVAETRAPYEASPLDKDEIARLIKDLESKMKAAARVLDFEKAALLRDRIVDLRKNLD
jgi:excinuclease ABC subunit B